MKITEVNKKAQYENFERQATAWLGYRVTIEVSSMFVGGVIGMASYDRMLFPFSILLSLICGFATRALLEIPKKSWSQRIRSELKNLPNTENATLLETLKRCKVKIVAAEKISRAIANCFLITALGATLVLCGYKE